MKSRPAWNHAGRSYITAFCGAAPSAGVALSDYCVRSARFPQVISGPGAFGKITRTRPADPPRQDLLPGAFAAQQSGPRPRRCAHSGATPGQGASTAGRSATRPKPEPLLYRVQTGSAIGLRRPALLLGQPCVVLQVPWTWPQASTALAASSTDHVVASRCPVRPLQGERGSLGPAQAMLVPDVRRMVFHLLHLPEGAGEAAGPCGPE